MIENLKDLKQLLKLCRSNGVTEIVWGSLSLKIQEAAPSTNPDIEEMEDQESAFMEAVEAPLTPEEMVSFAAGA